MHPNVLIHVFTFVVAICCATASHAQFSLVPMGTTDPQDVPDYLESVGDVIPDYFFAQDVFSIALVSCSWGTKEAGSNAHRLFSNLCEN